MSSPGNALNNSSNDANQNMSPTPAGSPIESCGSPPESPFDQTISPNKTHWIAIHLIDEKGRPVSGEDFKITLPDGTVVEGNLDGKGRAKITGIDSGSCKVSFPNRDTKDWKKIS
jgi:hypothetical protein